MINDSRILAIIPARGGSKAIPRKNVQSLGGKPLIAWTIEAGLGADYIDRIIVSTDDREIAEVASAFGCEIPFLRPPEIATDSATSAEVVRHAIENLDEEFDCVLLLQPTSPFRTSDHINEIIELMAREKAASVVSVEVLDKSPEWMFWLDADSMEISPVLPASGANRRQDCSEAYVLNGALYIITVDLFRQIGGFVSDGTLAYQMTKSESLDIDTWEDFAFAERQLGG